MTQTIWKYPFEIKDEICLEMPEQAQILTVQVQAGTACIWALVSPNPHRIAAKRWFRIYGTGHPVDEPGQYVGTFQLHGGALVFHLFEVTR